MEHRKSRLTGRVTGLGSGGQLCERRQLRLDALAGGSVRDDAP